MAWTLWNHELNPSHPQDPFAGLFGFADLFDHGKKLLGSNRVANLLGGPSGRTPPVNVYVGSGDAVITVELPGVDPAKIDISVDGESLSLSGERTLPEPKEGETLYRSERAGGTFSRVLRLPFRIDADKVTATYRHGVLEIEVSSVAEEKPRRIEVKSA